MQSYTPYEQVDQEELQKDIDQIKVTLGDPSWEDYQHLRMLERWGRYLNIAGYSLVAVVSYIELSSGLPSLL
ncbi:MAG TPA: fatty acid desaturase, partial [Epsilonproteobacteria bacterium]|nr:fatty acid desaturase [Campylobacterota bacterium]